MNRFFVGTAAWNIPKEFKEFFPEEGSHLTRYSQSLNAVEINSSFYKDHKASTYERWAESVPDDFLFSVKLSKIITHEKKLEIESEVLEFSLEPILKLGSKLGCLLIQIPPKLDFRSSVADEFFANLRQCYQGPVAFEPRHETWGSSGAERIFKKYSISQVIADPEPFPNSQTLERSFSGLIYYRLHGSPEIYRSNYDEKTLDRFSDQMKVRFQASTFQTWCIFDNTTFGFATRNAIQLKQKLQDGSHRFRDPPVIDA